MDCARFEDLLFEGLDARLDAAEEKDMRTHAQTCKRCRELAALMSGVADGAPPEVPVELVTGVLERTSGGSCGRAQLLLAERADRALSDDGGLLTIHLGTCKDCAAIARALVQLGHELPVMAELDPGAGFVAEVMAATVGTTEPRRVPLRVRIEEMWERVAQRPRLAFEGAYAGIVVLFLVFGLPSQTLAELPARAFSGIRQEGIKVERAVSSGLGEVVDFGRSTWTDSTERAAEYFASSERGSRAASRLESGLRAWAGAAQAFAARVWNELLAPALEQLRTMWRGPDDVTPQSNQ
jgi:hypothetical protein